jgi:hypothetical protein
MITNFYLINDTTTHVIWDIYYNNTYLEVGQNVLTPTPDIYEVILIMSCSSRSDSARTILKAVDYINTKTFGFNTSELNKDISIHPNPASQYVIIKNNTFNGQPYTIRIYNTVGELLYTSKAQNNLTRLDVQHWANGIYFIEVNEKRFKFIKK